MKTYTLKDVEERLATINVKLLSDLWLVTSTNDNFYKLVMKVSVNKTDYLLMFNNVSVKLYSNYVYRINNGRYNGVSSISYDPFKFPRIVAQFSYLVATATNTPHPILITPNAMYLINEYIDIISLNRWNHRPTRLDLLLGDSYPYTCRLDQLQLD